MAYCTQCGSPVNDNTKFCTECGAPLLDPQAICPSDSSQSGENPLIHLRDADYTNSQDAKLPIKKYDKNLKWWILASVISAILFAVAAGIWSSFIYQAIYTNDSKNVDEGLYTGVSAQTWGRETDIIELFQYGITVELKQNGNCTIDTGEDTADGTWKIDDGVLEIYDGENIISGTVKDGVMRLENIMNTGIDLMLLREDAQIPEENDNIDSSWWDREWYGWWKMSSCEGTYIGWDHSAWDCCAEIQVDANGQGHILIWDEDLPKDNSLAEMDIIVLDGHTSLGKAVNRNGYFMDMELCAGDITIEPGDMLYDDLICIDGWYRSGEDSFYYEIYLRPWGRKWDDLLANDENFAPYYYDQYVKAIENGEGPPEDITKIWGEK